MGQYIGAWWPFEVVCEFAMKNRILRANPGTRAGRLTLCRTGLA